jgi:hypothetical protein
MALRARRLQARRDPPPLVVPGARSSRTHGASGRATLRDGAGQPHRCVSRRSSGMTKHRSSVIALRLSGLRRDRRNSAIRPWQSVGLYSAGLRIRLRGPYFRRFLPRRTTMGLQIDKNLPSHSRILASTSKVRQAASHAVAIRSPQRRALASISNVSIPVS